MPNPLALEAIPYTTGNPRTIVVTNTGATAVEFGPVGFSGQDAGDFAASADSCSNHRINPGRRCRVAVDFGTTQPAGSAESAILAFYDVNANILATVDLAGSVVRRPVMASVSGLTVTLKNSSRDQYGMDFSIDGNIVDTRTGNCVDILFPRSSCTIVLKDNGSGGGTIRILVQAMGAGRNATFDIDLP